MFIMLLYICHMFTLNILNESKMQQSRSKAIKALKFRVINKLLLRGFENLKYNRAACIIHFHARKSGIIHEFVVVG